MKQGIYFAAAAAAAASLCPSPPTSSRSPSSFLHNFPHNIFEYSQHVFFLQGAEEGEERKRRSLFPSLAPLLMMSVCPSERTNPRKPGLALVVRNKLHFSSPADETGTFNTTPTGESKKRHPHGSPVMLWFRPVETCTVE